MISRNLASMPILVVVLLLNQRQDTDAARHIVVRRWCMRDELRYSTLVRFIVSSNFATLAQSCSLSTYLYSNIATLLIDSRDVLTI
jgi:hypothetical protein